MKKVKTSSRPSSAESVSPAAPLCFNCDVTMEKPDLFCGELRTQEASFVRYVRNIRHQGRDKQPDIEYVIRVKMAAHPKWWISRKSTDDPRSIRQEVITRAAGMWRCSTGKAMKMYRTASDTT